MSTHIFLAERPGDVLFFGEYLSKKYPDMRLTCLSNRAVYEALDKDIHFDFPEQFGITPLNISRLDWDQCAGQATETVASFREYHEAASVGWYSFFKLFLTLETLRRYRANLGSAKGISTLHLRAAHTLNLSRGLQGGVEPSGILPVYLALHQENHDPRITVWEHSSRRSIPGWGIASRLLRANLRLGASILPIHLQLEPGQGNRTASASAYDFLLDGWGYEIEKILDFRASVKELRAKGLSAAHAFYDFKFADEQEYRSCISEHGQAFIDGFQALEKEAPGRDLSNILRMGLYHECRRAAAFIRSQAGGSAHPLWRAALGLLAYGIIVDGQYALDRARRFVRDFPHKRYVSVAGDNRSARARMIAAGEIGATRFCVPHGDNFFAEPAPLFLGDFIVASSRLKRQELITRSGLAPEKIVVSRCGKNAQRPGIPSPSKPAPPYKVVMLLSDSHIEWSSYPAHGFEILMRSALGLFQRFGKDIHIAFKAHPGVKDRDQDILLGLAKRFQGCKLDFIHEQWDSRWRRGEWGDYHLCFSLDVISSLIADCTSNGVPFVFFTHPYSASPIHWGLDSVTVPVKDAPEITEFIARVLSDGTQYAAFQAKGYEISKVYRGQGLDDGSPAPDREVRGVSEFLKL